MLGTKKSTPASKKGAKPLPKKVAPMQQVLIRPAKTKQRKQTMDTLYKVRNILCGYSYHTNIHDAKGYYGWSTADTKELQALCDFAYKALYSAGNYYSGDGDDE
jgi:hypothetical protein